MPDSPALTAFRLFAREWGTDGWGHSWIRYNRHLATTLSTIIEGGLRFAPDDFLTIMRDTSWHIPGGRVPYHTAACACGNKSAADYIDRCHDRKPLRIGPHFPLRKGTDDRFVLRRAFVGRRFYWKEEWVTVTSFAPDGESVIACSYHPHPDQYKVLHRYRITRADFSPPKATSTEVRRG